MIKTKTLESGSLGGCILVLFADTKAEVPETGTATAAAIQFPLSAALSAGDIIYTAKLEVAVLKSDGTWEWGD